MKQKKTAEVSPQNMKTRAIFSIVSMVLIASMLAGLYLHFAWNRYSRMAKDEALQLAQSVEALLHPEHIAALGESLAVSDAASVEQSLERLVESTDSIYYAYILKQENGSIVVMADSSAADSPTSSPTKSSCEETAEINRLPFETGQRILTEPISLPYGTWIRALVPVKDPENGDIIAAFGLSYSASEWQENLWKRMIPDLGITVCLLVLMFTFLSLRHQHAKLKQAAANLKFQEALYRNIFEKAPIGILLQGNKDNQNNQSAAEYFSVNPKGEAILGRSLSELQKMTWQGITAAEDLEVETPLFDRFIKGEIPSYSIEKRLFKPDGSTIWVNLYVVAFPDNPFSGSMYLCLLEDVSERKLSEESRGESERSKAVFFSHLPGMAYRCKFDPNWTMEFVSGGCEELTGYTAEALIENREISYAEIIAPEHRDAVRTGWRRILIRHDRYRDEYEIATKSGKRKWVLELGQGIYNDDGNIEALEGIVLDISDQKNKERQIAYLSEHDPLTGLWNRNYLEQEKLRLDKPEFLPLSIAICDIDGLRMINDAYGHAEGDHLITKTATLIQGCLKSEYVLSHAGGGEFVLLLPHTGSTAAHQLKMTIKNTIENYNRVNKVAPYAISVSIGHGTKETEAQKIEDVMKAAEEYLSSRKLLNQNSSHSAIVASIMATLYAKSQETEAHGQRIGRFCQMMGEQLRLTPKELDDLQLLSKLHDIGKIGIDDSILNKPGKLSEEDWKVMKQHPYLGRNIAMSTPQLEHIADYILHHHERWDGAGYPMGLKGKETPVLSRILSIADAFDAMTEDRIYRKAMPYEAAIREIERNAGTQFDPEITRLFVERMAAHHIAEKSQGE